MALKHYSLTTNDTLPSIPDFYPGGILHGGGRRLQAVGAGLRRHGGTGFAVAPAIVTALVCAFFTSFTGASGVTILALGGVLMPVLIAAGYKERPALGLLTGAGSLGMLFPPCFAAHSLRDRGQPQRQRQRHDQADVPGRNRSRRAFGHSHGLVGRAPGAADRRRPPALQRPGGDGRLVGR